MIREYIPVLLENHDLTPEQAESAMIDIMTGQATPSQISAFLIGLKKKGETVDEITAIARVMRSFGRTVNPKVDGYLRSEEHTSELQSRGHLVCRLLLEKKKQRKTTTTKQKITV